MFEAVEDTTMKTEVNPMELANSYAAIVKSERQADGTLKVYGKATDETLDSDLQICDNAWLKSAMPEWFTTGGNIREQHSNIAAGVATEYEEKADGHYITALVVDANSVKKVEAGVLKGFSIGIKAPRVVRDQKAAGGRIIDGQIVEISLVDRPANPSAKMVIAKAAESGQLMAVEQFSVPTPAEMAASAVFSKSADPITPVDVDEAIEAPAEIVAEEVVDAPAEATTEEAPAEAEEAVEAPAEVSAETQIVEAAKSLLATINKFDQGKYDAAMSAVADLIVVEANEMKTGSDERDSIKNLLRSAKFLARWYEGEAANGEVPGVLADVDVAEDIFLAAEKSATVNVTVDDEQVSAIIDKAVASAKASVSDEIATLQSALEAEQGKASKLEQDLEVALAKAVAGGPKRAAANEPLNKTNDLLVKAAEYRAKAASTSDKKLSKGYAAIAKDFEVQAAKGKN